jgi:glucose-6-phosphate 1-dehydrogenase
MEPPIDFDADAVRNEKAKVLRATEVDAVVRGQYGRGYIEGKEVPGYREEEGIDPDSATETFVAAKLRVDTWRWADTPFYVRTGKRLAKRETTIASGSSAFRSRSSRTRTACARRARDSRAARPGVSLGSARGAGPGRDSSHREHGLPLRRGVPHRPAQTYRRSSSTRCAATPLFTRADEIRSSGGSSLDPARWADRFPTSRTTTRDVGTQAADELITRDGRSWRRH